MRVLAIIIFLFYALNILGQEFSDPKIAGMVHLEQSWVKQFDGKGVLFVKAIENKSGVKKEYAFTKIEKPHFPQLFLIGTKNVIQKGFFLQGQYEIVAEYYPHGLSGQSKVFVGQDDQNLLAAVGKKDLNIRLKMK